MADSLPVISNPDGVLLFKGEDRMTIFSYFVLKFHDGVNYHFRSWWAAGNIDIYRNNQIHTLQYGIVAVKTATGGAGAECHYPFRFTHLIVNPFDNRRFLVADGSYHHEHVGLARGKARQRSTETVGDINLRGYRHEFHAATGGYERVWKYTELAHPAYQLIFSGCHEIHHCHSSPPSFQIYTNVSVRIPKKKRKETNDRVAISLFPHDMAQINRSTVSRSNSRKNMATG